jgi:hypothetical protein
MQPMQQQDVTMLPAMVMMTIGRWNQILEVLGTRPWTEVNPLIVDIHRQIGDAVQAQTQDMSVPQQMPMRPNGGLARVDEIDQE